MEVVICYCLKCKSELGRFMNAWNGIGNTYFSPIYNIVSKSGLETTGDVYEAAIGSSIQHSLLRDVVCAKCRVVLGLRCDNAPDDHILKENQLILRLKETSIISEGSGEVANLSVLKVIPLKDDKNINLSTVPHTPSTIPTRRATASRTFLSDHIISGIHSGACEEFNSNKLYEITQPKNPYVESEINTLTIGVEKFRGWAEDIILSQQKDIDRLSGTMLRIERDMQTLKSYMQDLNNKFATDYYTKDQYKEVLEVRDEIKRLHVRLDQKEEIPEWNKAASLLARNMKTIAGDVKKLSFQVEHISGFKDTLEDLVDRVKLLELQEQCSTRPKIPSIIRKKSAETLSRKRNHELVEKNTSNKVTTTNGVTQVKVKKQRPDELCLKKNLEANIHVQTPDIVDLVSPEPDPQYFDKKEERSSVQENFSTIRKGILHQTPQVLIRASNTTKMLLLQEPKKRSEPSLGPAKFTGPDSDLLPGIHVKEDDKKQLKSDFNQLESIPKPYSTSLDGSARKIDIKELNHDTKLEGRYLRTRKSKASKD